MVSRTGSPDQRSLRSLRRQEFQEKAVGFPRRPFFSNKTARRTFRRFLIMQRSTGNVSQDNGGVGCDCGLEYGERRFFARGRSRRLRRLRGRPQLRQLRAGRIRLRRVSHSGLRSRPRPVTIMDVASSKATRSSLVTSPPTSASYAAQNIAEAACHRRPEAGASGC